MKKLIMIGAMLAVGVAFALDNEAWLAKARECAEGGFMMDSDETKEDGVYCLMLSAINTASDKSVDAQVGEAILDAKKKITAYVKGETVSASTSLESRSESVSVDGEKMSRSYKKFEKQIKTKVDALVKGVKMVGQVTVKEKSYVVCLTCEKFEDQTAALEQAQAQYGDEGVVVSVGEASSFDIAKQKAIRGAVEQVLGTVVVGYDKMSSKSEFQSKVFSGTDGVVEKYRILSDTDVATGKRIEIVAKVSKQNLLDNYSNYMKFLGDPAFYIETNSSDLASHFTEFFTDMGIRIAANPQEAKYAIFCAGTFRHLKHPTDDDHNGVQLSLRFRVQEINGKESLIDMKNDPRKSACFVGNDPERQKEICAAKAFRQMKKPLHEKIQMMVGKLVGRKMAEAAADDDED
ncbi:MAG: hypothetical protein ACI4RA_05250 [Kiritimatiellia bacterium]